MPSRPGCPSSACSSSATPADDGFPRYEDAVAAPPMPRQERSPDDQILLLTGGTTGLPKGVVWDSGGVCGVVSSAYRRAGVPVPRDAAEVVAAAAAQVREGTAPVVLPASPLMHGTGFFFSLGVLLRGGRVVTLPQRSLDPAALWTAVQEERVEELAIVGDAFAVPLLAELDRAAAAGTPYDLTAAAPDRQLRSPLEHGDQATAAGRRALHAAGLHRRHRGRSVRRLAVRPGPGRASAPSSRLPENARVIGPDGADVRPGSGEVGLLASTGNLPLGYLDDPEATAAVFRTIDGVRYAVPGDAATLAADGTISLLGRGSGVINTGGEKVFAEEVEQVLVEHPGVAEAVVVGVPDDRWGSRVAALVVPVPGAELDLDALADHVGSRLAGYKRPRVLRLVAGIPRTVSGKLDRRWAQDHARELAGPPQN